MEKTVLHVHERLVGALAETPESLYVYLARVLPIVDDIRTRECAPVSFFAPKPQAACGQAHAAASRFVRTLVDLGLSRYWCADPFGTGGVDVEDDTLVLSAPVSVSGACPVCSHDLSTEDTVVFCGHCGAHLTF